MWWHVDFVCRVEPATSSGYPAVYTLGCQSKGRARMLRDAWHEPVVQGFSNELII